MFHFDSNDYLCPQYLRKNLSNTYGNNYVSTNNTIMTHNTKVQATSV